MKKVSNYVPRGVRATLLSLYYTMLDIWDAVRGQGKDLPPRQLRGISTDPLADFALSGTQFVEMLRREFDLKPNERVLDVGCGVGRIAVALTHYLDHSATYEGFDIVPSEIAWCQKNITPRYPNFRFQLADIYNPAYHPEGKQRAAQYRFPYADASLDLAIVASVFTHLLSDEMEHYLSEIVRVLRPGGRGVISFYLLNPQTDQQSQNGLGAFQFSHQIENAFVQDAQVPTSAVAYREEFVRALFRKHNLQMREPLWYGTWSREKNQIQDLVFFAKPQV